MTESERQHKVLITGLGRSGTSVLVHFLTALGLPTGFSLEQCTRRYQHPSNAGLEVELDADVYIMKNPNFSKDMERLSTIYNLDMVYHLTRQVEEVASSRTSMGNDMGGFWHASNYEEQLEELKKVKKKLEEDLVKFQISTTEMKFPKFARDPQYCFECLTFLVAKFDISTETFMKVHKSVFELDRIRFSPTQ